MTPGRGFRRGCGFSRERGFSIIEPLIAAGLVAVVTAACSAPSIPPKASSRVARGGTAGLDRGGTGARVLSWREP